MSNKISVKVLLGNNEVQQISLPEGATVRTVLDSQGFSLTADMKASVNGAPVASDKIDETPVPDKAVVTASRGAKGAL